MKAYLVTKEGFVREYEVHKPYPPVIKMAQNGPAQIYDPGDLMSDEKLALKTIRFRFDTEFKGPPPYVFYQEDVSLESKAAAMKESYDYYMSMKKHQDELYQYKLQQQMMMRMQVAAPPVYTTQYDYATNNIPWDYSPLMSAQVPLSPLPDSPEPVKPKPSDIPEPIEPKPRLMKK